MKKRIIYFILCLMSALFLHAENDSTLPVPPVQPTIIFREESIVETHNAFLYDSLFSSDRSQIQNDIYETHQDANGDYTFPIILLIMLIYLAWFSFTYQKELRENLVVLVNSGLGQQIYRDREFSANIFKFITFLNFSVICGMIIYLSAMHFDLSMPTEIVWLNIALAVGFVIIAYMMKGIIYRTLGGLYQMTGVISYFRFNSLVIYQVLGIALFPLTVLAVFAASPVSEWSLVAALSLAGLAFLVRMVKGFSLLGMVKNFHILYFLLYICALEIAPVLILIRFFSMWA